MATAILEAEWSGVHIDGNWEMFRIRGLHRHATPVAGEHTEDVVVGHPVHKNVNDAPHIEMVAALVADMVAKVDRKATF